MATPDAIVVGGGLAGLSVAAELVADHAVWVVDRRPPASEASAHNAGMLRRMGEDPFERALACRTHQRLATEPRWRGASRVVGAVLAFGRDRTHLHDAAAHLRAAGLSPEWSDAVGDVAPVLRGSPLLGGWVLPDERVVDAWAVASGCLDAVREGGGTVRRAEATLVREGARCGVRVGDDTRWPERVVLAAGAWCASLARSVGLERPLFPLRRTLLHTEPHPLASPGHPWCWVDDEGVYLRPESGGWLISGCDEAVDFPSGAESRGPVEAQPRALALDKLERFVPALGPVRFRTGWSGLRTFAPDRRPLLGRDPEVENLWWCAGFGGFGVSCALAAGEVLAAWMRGQPTFLRPAGLSPGRPMLAKWMVRERGDLEHATPTPGALPERL